jgi:Ca2+-binding RTX toxin-like protein
VRRHSTILISVAALGALLAVPTGARAAAGTATLTGNLGSPTSSLNADAGFGDNIRHAITVSYAAGSYLVTDSAGLTAGEGCVQVLATSASCVDPPARPTTGIGVSGSAAPDTLTVNSVGPPEVETQILGAKGNDSIVAHEDTIASPRGADLLKGDDGNDTIDGGYGPDVIFGGAGVDTTTYADRGPREPVRVSIDPDFKPGDIPDGGAGEGDSIYTENVVGGAGNDTLSGVNSEPHQDAGLSNGFTGGPGIDTLLGGPGGDHLNGGTGNDKLSGGQQKDTLIGGAGRDRCVGGPSKDKAKQCERKGSI